MKTKLLLAFFSMLMATAAWADVEINETTFPDENFRQLLLTRWYGIDGVLTDEEIASVPAIEVNGKRIKSLEGIEYFTALTLLSCSVNELTELDVSKNTALTTLKCYSNQLTTLDVSKNTELTTLYCHYNQLTALDVSQNTALRFLDCSINQLTTLDVSQNTALRELHCGDNPLVALDVSRNTALYYLSCYNNQLQTLDVSQNTALTLLYCYDNQLTTLDLSQNTALNVLYCYQNQIKDGGMDALVASLPTISGGGLRVIYNENEGNVMTIDQVAAAKAKGWIPYYYTGELSDWGTQIWNIYDGSEPANPKGDLNGDGKTDMADAVSVLNLMAEGSDDSAADLNGDGKVDIADFVSVLNLMAEQ